ncbi:MAG TPA: hypothetical protein VIJ85_00855, partial [Rhizomicrobium sp.]
MSNNTFGIESARADRSAWQIWPLRLFFSFIVLVAVDVGCMIVPAWLTHTLGKRPDPIVLVSACALAVVLMIFAYRMLVRWTEKRRADELGLQRFAP